MKIRLQEVEFGANDPTKSKEFYQSVLGLDVVVDQNELKVFDSGIKSLDFNIATHFSPGVAVISFLTDDLKEVMDRLASISVPFDKPKPSHLGMLSISFEDPDGHIIKVNSPTN